MGGKVPADLRLVEALELKVRESRESRVSVVEGG